MPVQHFLYKGFCTRVLVREFLCTRVLFDKILRLIKIGTFDGRIHMAEPPTLVDRIVTRAKNHRVLGVLILVGIAVISVGKLVGAIKPILDLFRGESTTTSQQAKSPNAVQSP